MTFSLSELWTRTRRVYRRYGFVGFCCKAFYLLLQKLAGIEVVYAMQLDLAQVRAPRALGGDLKFRFLSADDVRAEAATPGVDLDESRAERLGWGWNFCFGAFAADRLISYAWYAERAPEVENGFCLRFALPPGSVYEYWAFTAPEFRGQGVHGAALWHAAEQFRHRGFTQVVAVVHTHNWASLCSHEKLGFRRAGRLITFRRRRLTCAVDKSVCLGAGADGCWGHS